MMANHIISNDSMSFWKGFLNRQFSHCYLSIPNNHEDNLKSEMGKSLHVYGMKRQAWERNSYQAQGCSCFSSSRLCGFKSGPSLFSDQDEIKLWIFLFGSRRFSCVRYFIVVRCLFILINKKLGVAPVI